VRDVSVAMTVDLECFHNSFVTYLKYCIVLIVDTLRSTVHCGRNWSRTCRSPFWACWWPSKAAAEYHLRSKLPATTRCVELTPSLWKRCEMCALDFLLSTCCFFLTLIVYGLLLYFALEIFGTMGVCNCTVGFWHFKLE